MLYPTDGTVVDNTSSTIGFGGYTLTAEQSLELQYGIGETWNHVVSARTADRVSFELDGQDLFAWSFNTALPARAWQPGTTGHFARVRVRLPGAGPEGSDAYLTTVGPDWGACLGENRQVLTFMSRCGSANSPVAYLFTRDYPTSIDLDLISLSPLTRATGIRIRNGGRAGTITRVECRGPDSLSGLDANEAILPGETKFYRLAVAPIGTVTCTVIGENLDGSPEANTFNNDNSRHF